MEHFNINEILKTFNPDIDELGKVLFPNVKYTRQAFDRVLRGETYLDTKQIEALAEYLGVFVSELFNINEWHGSYDACINSLVFIKGKYRVLLNYEGSFISVYENNECVQKVVAPNKKYLTIEEFIKFINNLIYKKNGNN